VSCWSGSSHPSKSARSMMMGMQVAEVDQVGAGIGFERSLDASQVRRLWFVERDRASGLPHIVMTAERLGIRGAPAQGRLPTFAR